MPELPEVETVVRMLRPSVEGRTITLTTFPAVPGRMTNLAATEFIERIKDQRIVALNRRAKYLVFRLDKDYLIVHLKMTGHLYVLSPQESSRFDRWLRVKFGF